ncbi:hypothetical protein LTR97_012222 [Elasticomyces elasticus]|uniref:Uncharacterized protein n=1 Tax=Elasticomyces elasticus TaxID=574655 RepID=A0AAN7W0C8_9PEZI|nr:hypothetical protein LTR97_012222 [Elasticomyces elasticus]
MFRRCTSRGLLNHNSLDADDKPLMENAPPKQRSRQSTAEYPEDDQPSKKKTDRSGPLKAPDMCYGAEWDFVDRDDLCADEHPVMGDDLPGKHAAISKEELASYHNADAKAREWLGGLEKHEQALIDQINVFADRVAAIMERLNEENRVPRVSIEEYGQPDFDTLIHAAEALPGGSNEQSFMFDGVRTAVLVQLGTVPNKIRLGLVDICKVMQDPTQEIRKIWADGEELEKTGFKNSQAVKECCTTLEGLKSKATELYRTTLQAWAGLVAESQTAVQTLENQYVAEGQPHRHTRCGVRQVDDVVRVIMSDYENMTCAYEAAFATAAMLSPATFAYESWRNEI